MKRIELPIESMRVAQMEQNAQCATLHVKHTSINSAPIATGKGIRLAYIQNLNNAISATPSINPQKNNNNNNNNNNNHNNNHNQSRRDLNNQSNTVEEYTKRVYVSGVGYTAWIKSSSQEDKVTRKDVLGKSAARFLELKIGFSDIKRIEIPEGLTVLLVDPRLSVGKQGVPGGARPGVAAAGKGAAGGASKGARSSSKQDVDSPVKLIIIIRGQPKEVVTSFAARILQFRPLSRYKGIGLSFKFENKFKEKVSKSSK